MLAFPNLNHPPRRVVSLVPSTTESLFDLGLGERVIGITDYCTFPEKELEGLPRLGGPKNPNVEAILNLKPDLVLANQEENTRQAIEDLRAGGAEVWVSFPCSVSQAVEFLFQLAGIFQNDHAVDKVNYLAAQVEQMRGIQRAKQRRRYFCPIWRDRTATGLAWWMTFNRDTYIHDLLDLLGGENVFADRQRRYPLEADLGLRSPRAAQSRDRRYPRVSIDELAGAGAEVILLPSEPYEFGAGHEKEFEQLIPGIAAKRVEGSLLTWHGTRLGQAVQELAGLFEGE